MNKRRVGYVIWLLTAICLYFFENNAGTRIILLCTILVPPVPALRGLFFGTDAPRQRDERGRGTVRAYILSETEEPGDVRPFRPGDPIRRIHWKLSARTREILVRENAREHASAEIIRPERSRQREKKSVSRRRMMGGIASGAGLCIILLAAWPSARGGFLALLNRLFTESEKVNAYAYDYFPAADDRYIWIAAGLLSCTALLAAAGIVLARSRKAALAAAVLCAAFQIYFGLTFPGWIHILFLGIFALWMMKRPAAGRSIRICAVIFLLVSALTFLLFPGVDPVAETASESVRDWLTPAAGSDAGTAPDAPAGITETRRMNTRTLETGEQEARTEKAYHPETAEEEQISAPHRVDYLKIILGLLQVAAVIILPFAPFVLLNARKRKAREARERFGSDNTAEALTAIFRQVIIWLEATRHSGGNRLFREWTDVLPETAPDGYAGRFLRCASDYEEAAYSGHSLPEEKRERALELLKETEQTLWREANRGTRLKLKYWMCLRE